MATRAKKSQGISPTGKIAILVILFGIPMLFALSSWGLSKIFETVPYVLIGVLVLVATVYTAHTVSLMYKFYEVDPPVLRFIPCMCEIALIDVKYHKVCYALYALAVVFIALSQLPYEVLKVFGEAISLNGGFYMMVLALLMLTLIQIVKGIGLNGCMHDIEKDWKRVNHTDLGMIDKLIILGFIPFVRVIALYSLNKPLSTLVEFMEVSSSDIDEKNNEFYEE